MTANQYHQLCRDAADFIVCDWCEDEVYFDDALLTQYGEFCSENCLLMDREHGPTVQAHARHWGHGISI